MNVLRKMAFLPVFIAMLIAAVVIFSVPHFREIFVAFDAEVPALTRVMLARYWCVLIVPLFAIIGCALTESGTKLRAKIVQASLALSGLAFGVFVLAMFSPIYALGASGV